MKNSEYTNMRIAFERAHSVMEDHRLPGQCILDAMEATLEEGGYRAPRLVELPSRKEVVVDSEGKTDNGGIIMSLSLQGGGGQNQQPR